MKLLKLYIGITNSGKIAYSQTKSVSGVGVLGTTRLVQFPRNQQQPDNPYWLFTDYLADDYQTLVDSGWDVIYVNPKTGDHFTQEDVDAMDDISLTSDSSESVDSFAS